LLKAEFGKLPHCTIFWKLTELQLIMTMHREELTSALCCRRVSKTLQCSLYEIRSEDVRLR